MAQMIIDVSRAEVSWPGTWWVAQWGGVTLCVKRDPARDIARSILRSGRANADDLIVLRLNGEVVDEERIGDAAKRKPDPSRLSARKLLIELSDATVRRQ